MFNWTDDDSEDNPAPLDLARDLGRGMPAHRGDLMGVADALDEAGVYDKSRFGNPPLADEHLFKAIERFQDDQGLEVDGLMKPGGPTVTRLNAVLGRRAQRRCGCGARRGAGPGAGARRRRRPALRRPVPRPPRRRRPRRLRTRLRHLRARRTGTAARPGQSQPAAPSTRRPSAIPTEHRRRAIRTATVECRDVCGPALSGRWPVLTAPAKRAARSARIADARVWNAACC